MRVATFVGFLVAALIWAAYIQMLRCPEGWVMVEGEPRFLVHDACIGVVDGVVRVAPPEVRFGNE